MFKVLQESPPIPETLSSVGKDFLQNCFRRDPADRPSSSTLLKHAFVQNLHDQDVLGHPQSYPRGDLGPGVSANFISLILSSESFSTSKVITMKKGLSNTISNILFPIHCLKFE